MPPTFSVAHCPTCEFKDPCALIETDGDWQAKLEADYFIRGDDDVEELGLGRSRVQPATATVRLRWD